MYIYIHIYIYIYTCIHIHIYIHKLVVLQILQYAWSRETGPIIQTLPLNCSWLWCKYVGSTCYTFAQTRLLWLSTRKTHLLWLDKHLPPVSLPSLVADLGVSKNTHNTDTHTHMYTQKHTYSHTRTCTHMHVHKMRWNTCGEPERWLDMPLSAHKHASKHRYK